MTAPAEKSLFPERSRRSKRIWFAVVLAFCGLALAAQFFLFGVSSDLGCVGRLKALWDDVAVTSDDGETLLASSLPDPTRWRCRSGAYEYHPFDGPVHFGSESGVVRAIAWCPRPCHGGCRRVLFETKAVVPIPEESFQELVRRGLAVSPDEIIRMVNAE